RLRPGHGQPRDTRGLGPDRAGGRTGRAAGRRGGGDRPAAPPAAPPPPPRPAPAGGRAAADGLMAAATGLEQSGRPLAAANIALPIPEEPLARLWHAATLLREHRGDGHVAALVAADLDGAEALLLRIGTEQAGDASHVAASWGRDQMQPVRGWTDAQWDAAAARLAARGLLDHDGAAT